jgi:hypothetical protein
MHITDWRDEDVFVRWKHDCLCVSGGAYSLTSIYAARSQPLFPLSLLTTTNSIVRLVFVRSLNTLVSFRLLFSSNSSTVTWNRIQHPVISTGLIVYKSHLLWIVLVSYLKKKCQRRRRAKERRLKSRNYARKRSVLAKKRNPYVIGPAIPRWWISFFNWTQVS